MVTLMARKSTFIRGEDFRNAFFEDKIKNSENMGVFEVCLDIGSSLNEGAKFLRKRPFIAEP